MNCTRILIGAAALALACDAFPEAINISPVELENLGVRFEAPRRSRAF